MYEVTQNVDLSSKVGALSKKFDQLLALNTLPTNSPNVQNNKVGEPIKNSDLNENEIEEIDIETKIEKKIEKELISSSNSKTLESSPMTLYKPKGDGLMFYICYNFCMIYT
ncbi:hypothetical protein M9H77_35967 [Catharanthus roseus]|uniref:Uncharacterized protein n=1 Tax=Catharanthus roseus TaxID=4058 RepID=A0ACB9ZSP2_CATRO|nr:hypothetical protein M9H77_35967 [Catharanthus roseus]